MTWHVRDWVVAVGAALTLVAVLLGVQTPSTGLAVAAAPLLLAAVVSSAPARLVVVVAGAMLVLQSSDSIGPAKLGYLGVAGMCVAVSGWRLAASRTEVVAPFRPMLWASGLLMFLLAGNAGVAAAHDIPRVDWIRDASPYLLLAALPVVGLDAAADLSPAAVERLIGIFGVVAAIGFAVSWLDRRGVSSLGVERLVLSTTTLAALGFSYALVRAGSGPDRARWAALAVTILTFMLVNGTRTNLVLLAALFGVVGVPAKARVTFARGLALVLGLVLATAAVVPALAARLSDDPQFLSRRVEDLRVAVTGGPDQSLQARAFDSQVARSEFGAHLWLGEGAGHLYDQPSGPAVPSLDSPWAVAAKFGIVGVAVLLVLLVAVVRSMVRARRASGPALLYTAGRGWLFVLTALGAIIPWTEDKGTALALTLLVAAAAARVREAAAPDPVPGPAPVARIPR